MEPFHMSAGQRAAMERALAATSQFDFAEMASFEKVAKAEWEKIRKSIDVSAVEELARQRDEVAKFLSSPGVREAQREIAKHREAVAEVFSGPSMQAVLAARREQETAQSWMNWPRESALDEMNRALTNVPQPEMRTLMPPVEYVPPSDRVSDLEQQVAAQDARIEAQAEEIRQLRAERVIDQEMRQLLVQTNFRAERIVNLLDPDPFVDPSADDDEPEQLN